MTMSDHVCADGSLLQGLFWPGHLVGDREFAFDPRWVRGQLKRWRAKHRQLNGRGGNDVCVVVGNGPSLNAVDLDLLADRDVFISNYAFFNHELAARAKYLCIVNYLVAEQEADAINDLQGVVKLFPYWLSYCLNPDSNTYFFDARAGTDFSVDAAKWVSWQSTVSFSMLQIAYSLGYRKVLLVGFDHEYQQPSSAKEGEILRQDDDDRNHFANSYFKGKYWQAANVANMERTYAICRSYFERDGREIVNCTVGGRLETFRRGELEDELLREAKTVPVSLVPAPSVGFRIRNVSRQVWRFCASRSGIAVGAVWFLLVALNGSFFSRMLPNAPWVWLAVDLLTFLLGFGLVGYLYVKVRAEIERAGR